MKNSHPGVQFNSTDCAVKTSWRIMNHRSDRPKYTTTSIWVFVQNYKNSVIFKWTLDNFLYGGLPTYYFTLSSGQTITQYSQ